MSLLQGRKLEHNWATHVHWNCCAERPSEGARPAASAEGAVRTAHPGALLPQLFPVAGWLPVTVSERGEYLPCSGAVRVDCTSAAWAVFKSSSLHAASAQMHCEACEVHQTGQR